MGEGELRMTLHLTIRCIQDRIQKDLVGGEMKFSIILNVN